LEGIDVMKESGKGEEVVFGFIIADFCFYDFDF
jgi:hypothetical protein